VWRLCRCPPVRADVCCSRLRRWSSLRRRLVAKQRISSARQCSRRSQPRTVPGGTPRSAPIRPEPAPPRAAARLVPITSIASARRRAYQGGSRICARRTGRAPGPAAAAPSRRPAAGSPAPGRGPTGPAARCRTTGRPAGRPPDRRRQQRHRRTTARQAFQITRATMPGPGTARHGELVLQHVRTALARDHAVALITRCITSPCPGHHDLLRPS